MMRALFSGVTGLRTHQTKMDVIGNNISNVNTLGYKKSQANFSDIYSETVSPSSAPSANNGGINAKQVGLGVQMASIQIKHNPGAAQYTGNTLDLAIQGDGFFAVRTNSDGRERYTRAGNLSISSNGSLVTSAGNFVQCFTSSYKAGDAGVVSSNGFIGTDGKPNKANGFSSFSYTPDYGGVVTTASGTYTVELSSDNTHVILMKNGIAVGEPVAIKESNGTPLTTYVGFKANTDYVIDLPELGQIRFRTDGHRVNTNVSGLSIEGLKQGSFEISTAPADVDNADPDDPNAPRAIDSYALGEYKLTINEDGTAGTLAFVTQQGQTAPDNVPGAAVTIMVQKLPDENGTMPELAAWTPADGLNEGEQVVIRTELGDIRFGVSTNMSTTDAIKKLQQVASSTNLTLLSGAGEGPSNLTTGLASLNGLLTGASISVTNNDAFQATATRGDMVINQDLFENVSINEEGAVIGQLKSNVTGEVLAREAGIIGAEDMAAGEKVVLGYVALATFSNYEGLEKVGTNLYEMTSNSGRVMYYTAGTGGTGSIAASSLEMSNVDLSEEMVSMITTQRGFQANSRIITTTDSMLEELINLKR